MRTEQIYLDMDGTIVNYHDRFYIVYSIACCRIGIKPLSRIDWLKCRKNGTPAYPAEVNQKIQDIFDELFESPEYLCFDKLIRGMKEVVIDLRNKYKTYIVSYRAYDKNLKDQLNEYGIYNINTIIQGFHHNLPTDEKANMICKAVINPSGWIIGDTQYEIISGQKLGLKTIACSWGDKSRDSLAKYNPDFIVDYPAEILDIIK